MLVARAAPTRVEPVLEVGVAASHAARGVEGVGADRRAAEVGVEEHTGRVDHRLQTRAPLPCHASLRVGDDCIGIDRVARGGGLPRRVEGIPGGVHEERVGEPVELRGDPIDGREGAPRVHSRTYNMEVKGSAATGWLWAGRV